MKNKKPSQAVEKRWLQRVVEHGCVVNGNSQVQVHHSMGREARSQKMFIGRWFVLPLSEWLHDVGSNHPWNITHHRNDFIKQFGSESELWHKMICKLSEQEPLPFGEDVINAVLATSR